MVTGEGLVMENYPSWYRSGNHLLLINHTIYINELLKILQYINLNVFCL